MFSIFVDGKIIVSMRKPKRPNYEAVAARAEVSKATVSLVLRGLGQGRIPQATRDRVIQAARDLGYVQNGLVRAIQRGTTETVAVVAPSLSYEHVARIVDGIRSHAALQGFSILLSLASDDAIAESESADKLLQHRVDGIIRFSGVPDPGTPPDWLSSAIQHGIPCVIIDDLSLAGQVDCVVSDDYQGAYDATTYLLSLGYNKIAHLAGDQGRTSAIERTLGYKAALHQAKNSYEVILGNRYDGVGLAELLDEAFSGDQRPEALFCCTDAVAAITLKYGVPVVGFGGTGLAIWSGIPSVRQCFEEMGGRAFDLLKRRIDGSTEAFTIDRVPTTLINTGANLTAQDSVG